MNARRDPLIFVGLTVVTLAAAIGSFGALRGTALLAGWSPDMSPLLPITVDATAAVASRVWLSPETPTDKARTFARNTAFAAIAVSLLGNGIYHLAQAGYLRPGVWLVIGAGGISPLALAVVAHLAVLRGGVPAPAEVPATAPAPITPTAPEFEIPAAQPVPVTVQERAPRSPRPRPHTRTTPAADEPSWDELVAAARDVDDRARHATGRPAGIARLRAELKIGQSRAQALRDHLRALPEPQRVPVPVDHANGHAVLAAAG